MSRDPKVPCYTGFQSASGGRSLSEAVVRLLILYLDTSVPSAFFDERDQARMLATRGFWEKLSSYSVLISDLCIREIRQIPDEARRDAAEQLLRQFTVVPIDEEVRNLGAGYMHAGVFGQSSATDALHVAAAVVGGADVVVSWNFQHMVKLRTIHRVNAANLESGYRQIDIRSPLEL